MKGSVTSAFLFYSTSGNTLFLLDMPKKMLNIFLIRSCMNNSNTDETDNSNLDAPSI